MPTIRAISIPLLVKIAASLLILKVVATMIGNYRDYIPPNFTAEFLLGREAYFFGSYQWAFYLHILSGPITLLLGLVLISERFRWRFPKWHRRLGRVQAIGVLLFVTPSGLWMALRAAGGPIAVVGFAVLAILTAACVMLGWRAAVGRRFETHRRWMWRCYLLLCSAVIIRMIGGFALVTGFHAAWIDPLAAWASWLLPLLGYEMYRVGSRYLLRPPIQKIPVASRAES
jgi:hypothetical protein